MVVTKLDDPAESQVYLYEASEGEYRRQGADVGVGHSKGRHKDTAAEKLEDTLKALEKLPTLEEKRKAKQDEEEADDDF